MIRVIHKKCGKVAFHVLRKWKEGDFIQSSNVILSNGNHPDVGSQVICESCKEPFWPVHTEVVQQHWTDWFVMKENE